MLYQGMTDRRSRDRRSERRSLFRDREVIADLLKINSFHNGEFAMSFMPSELKDIFAMLASLERAE